MMLSAATDSTPNISDTLVLASIPRKGLDGLRDADTAGEFQRPESIKGTLKCFSKHFFHIIIYSLSL